MLSMGRVCVLRHQTDAQYLAVKYTKESAEMRTVFAPAPHPDPKSRLNSAIRVESFLPKARGGN